MLLSLYLLISLLFNTFILFLPLPFYFFISLKVVVNKYILRIVLVWRAISILTTSRFFFFKFILGVFSSIQLFINIIKTFIIIFIILFYFCFVFNYFNFTFFLISSYIFTKSFVYFWLIYLTRILYFCVQGIVLWYVRICSNYNSIVYGISYYIFR